MRLKNRAVFLDRDGTLMEDVDYCSDPEKVRIFPGVTQALLRLRDAGFQRIVITNQSGIGRGLMTPEQYAAVEKKLLDLLGGDAIDATYFCPDMPGQTSARRKPRPGMVIEAARDWKIDLERSFFIGDKASDIECGRNAGVQTILVETGCGKAQRGCAPDFVASDFAAAAEYILARS